MKTKTKTKKNCPINDHDDDDDDGNKPAKINQSVCVFNIPVCCYH